MRRTYLTVLAAEAAVLLVLWILQIVFNRS